MCRARLHTTQNTELKDLRNIICLSKSYISVERISVYKVTENLVEHCRHYFILSAMLLHQLLHRSVTIATTELSKAGLALGYFFLSPPL